MLKLLLPAIFLLSSLTAHAASDCSSIMQALMKREAQVRVEAPLEHLRQYAKKLELPVEAIDEIAIQWNQGLSDLPSESAENWLLYVKTLLPENQVEAMQLMARMKSADSDIMIKRFQKIEKKIAHKQKKYRERAIKRIQKKLPELEMGEVLKRAEHKTDLYMKSYRKLSFECRSKTTNPTRKKAASIFKKFTIGIGIVSSFGGMAYANRDNELEDWIGQFGYETVIGIITGNIASKIVSNPRNSDLAKSIKKYFLSRGTGLVDMALFGMIFGANDEEAKARLEEVLSDPDKAARLRQMQQVFEEKKLYQKIKSTFIDKLKSIGGKVGLEDEPPFDLGVDWGNLSDADLEREDVQDVLLAAAIAELYAEGEGEMIATGNVGADRYSFHAAYGLIMLPKDMFTTMYIYNTLCLGLAQPKTAIIKATAIFALNRLVFDQIYYSVRRSAINQ
ncbi:MAG: hypothetical protein CME71_04225 [Halobacteriovorax sp.]|nr:hypothetical protein [Halobacteriovorax sp.]